MVSPTFMSYPRLSKEMPLVFTSTFTVISAETLPLKPLARAVALVVPPFRGMYFSVISS